MLKKNKTNLAGVVARRGGLCLGFELFHEEAEDVTRHFHHVELLAALVCSQFVRLEKVEQGGRQ